MRWTVVLLVSVAIGCGGSDPSSLEAAVDATVAPTPPAWCDGKTSYIYDPVAGKALETFPDDYFTQPDAGSATGLRLRVDSDLAPWIAAIPGSYRNVFEALSTLDGWGTTAGIILRFSGPLGALPSGEKDSVTLGGLRLYDLDEHRRVPFEVEVTDEGTTAILWPMVPLVPKHRHGVVMTTSARAAGGDCIAPSSALRSLLDGSATDARLAPLVPRYEALLAEAALKPDEVSAATVFTTQSISETSEAVATDVAARTYSWSKPATCTTEAAFRRCEARFLAWDYRKDDVVRDDGKPVASYEIPVRLWLPLTGGPFPTLIFGHGLGGDKDQGTPLAEAAAPLGFATVAIDAVAHGEHPAGATGEKLLDVMKFFGVDIATQRLLPLVLRDNWRQSTYDKLQLVRLLRQAPDIDGDGTADLDPSHLAYFGVSLGGIMGSELLALGSDVGAAILSVPGGRVSTIIRDAAQFEIVIVAMKPEGVTDGDVARFFPVLQTLVERGDAANYAPHVLGSPLPGGAATHPQLLVDVVIGDDTVPPGCNRSLVRALGVPHLSPVLEPVGIVSMAGAAPLSGNLDGGKTTAGLFQYDRITDEGKVVAATHSDVARSPEAILQTTHFLETWLKTGVAEILDPYAVLGTPAR